MSSDLSATPFKAPKSSEEWTQHFINACQSGNLAVVKKLCSPELKAIGDLHAWDERGFQLACANGHLDLVKFLTTSPKLLDAGHTWVNIHADNEYGFRLACSNGHLEIVKFLTTSDDLLKAGHSFADIHAKDELGFRYACEKGHLEIVQFLTTSPELIKAAHSLADIHYQHEYGFRLACLNGHLDIVKFLTTSPEIIKAGHTFVDIHAENEEGFGWACAKGHMNVVQFLIFELKIERTPTLNAIIKDYPQVQELFKIREEQEQLQEIMNSNQSFQNSLLRLAVILNQIEGHRTSTHPKKNDLNTRERKSAISTIRRL